MKALFFLLWIPAIILFYLSLHNEILKETRHRDTKARRKP
jgi:hypothetical protein